MKLKLFVGLVVLSFLVVVPLWAEESKEVTAVKGYVEIDQADDDGTIKSIGIWNSEQGEFLAVEVGKGKDAELRKEMGKLVLVKGYVSEDAGGLKSIEVLEFELLPDDSVPSEDDNDDDVLDD